MDVEPTVPTRNRQTGIQAVGPAAWGTHFSLLHDSPHDLLEVLVPFCKAGLDSGELCIWVTSPQLRASDVWDALARAVPELDSHRQRGRIELVPHTEWALDGSGFDRQKALGVWTRMLDSAPARGCDGVRLACNTCWPDKSDWKGFVDYEAAVDSMLLRYRMLVLCSYAQDQCGVAELADVVGRHAFSLLKRDGAWDRVQSFHQRRLPPLRGWHGDSWGVVPAFLESEERYSRLFQSLSEGVALHEVIFDDTGRPSDFRFLEVNPAFEQMTGLRRDQVLGRTALEVSPALEPIWIDKCSEVLSRGDPVHFASRAADLGRDYDAIAFRTRPGQFATLFVDVTASKQTERLYAVLSRANEAIVRVHDESALFQEVCRIVSQEGQFPLVWIGLCDGEEVKPAASFGPAVSYLDGIQVRLHGDLGKGPTGTCAREARPVINDDFDTNPRTVLWRAHALRHGFRASAAFPLRRGGKTIGALTLYAKRPGVFDAAQVGLLEALCADLSYALDAMAHDRLRAEAEQALRASEQSLREVNQRKNEFLATLSHELRNPLAPIRNSLHVLDRAIPGTDQAERARRVINRQVAQLSRLVDDLLDLTRIERNKVHLQRQRVDLNRIVERTADDQRSLFDDKGIQLEVELDSTSPYVSADPARLSQVISNLLQNAAKFTPPTGRTSLSVRRDLQGGSAIVRVTDNGVGMAPETLARLYEPFMQADDSLDRSKGGLGLGLALVKGLVEMHGGHVRAHSDGLGKGSSFEVLLPLESQAASEADAPRLARRPRMRRVLIIEDNVDAADSLREVLEIDGHEVAVAYDGPMGVARARELRPEVVLCDIGLPGMSGFEVAQAIRADAALGGIFLVALSGYALPEDLQRAQEAGFDEHLAKPPSLLKLEELLQTLPSTPPTAKPHESQ